MKKINSTGNETRMQPVKTQSADKQIRHSKNK